MLDRQALVLNADYRPLSTWPLSLLSAQDAVMMVYKGKAHLVEDWGEIFRSPSGSMPVPKVVALNSYVSVHSEPKFCRRSIYLRDRYRCQYCGVQFPTQELTYDHVIPRAKGGQTVWTNILTCCVKCNSDKGHQHADYSGRRGAGTFRPLKEPRRPTSFELLKAGLEFLDSSVSADFASWLYWNSELKA